MYEWVWVVILGAIGGASAILLTEQFKIASADPTQSAKENQWRLVRLLGQSTLGGILASLIVWAGNTNELTLGSTSLPPPQIAASLIAGLGGVAAVRFYIQERGRATTLEKVSRDSFDRASASADTVKEINSLDSDVS